MTLPPELRCYIYNYLPELVYRPLCARSASFHAPQYAWPVYRMPTAALSICKQVRDEMRDSLVQGPLRRLNDSHPPTVVLGPNFSMSRRCIILPEAFFQHIQAECIDTEIAYNDALALVSHRIADMYIPQGSSEISADCHIHDSIRSLTDQTLKRMRFHGVREVALRVVMRGSGFRGNRLADRRMLAILRKFRSRLSRDRARPVEDSYVGDSLTIVTSHDLEGLGLERTIQCLRTICKVTRETAGDEDQKLLDRSCYFDYRRNYQYGDVDSWGS